MVTKVISKSSLMFMIERIKNAEYAKKRSLDLFRIRDQLFIVRAARTNDLVSL